MLDGLTGIISQLEKQKAAIERALAALREVDGGAPVARTPAAKRKATNKHSLAQKARWAAKKAAPVQAVEGGMNEIGKPGMTDAGRKRLSEAMKKRWAVKRAGSAVKKRAGRPKKSA